MIRTRLLRLALLAGELSLLLGTISADPAHAQSLASGALFGVIRDSAGRPVGDAEIRIVDRASGAVRNFVTARDGEFRVSLLTPSTYDVSVEALGFRPALHVGVAVVAGGAPTLRVTLRRAPPPVTVIDTVRSGAARAAPLAWLNDRGYAELVSGRRMASGTALLSPVADDEAVEGLPWRLADLTVDGARVGPVGAPGATGSATTALAAPSRGLAGITVGGTGFDVEASGSGVGINALSLRAGRRTMRTALFGGTSDVGAAFIVGGPVQGDTAYAIAGLDYQRSEIARPAFVTAGDVDGLALLDVARDSFATSLAPYSRETTRLEERVSGFGRLDWQLANRYVVTLRGAGSRLVTADPPLLSGAAAGLGSQHHSTAVQASVNVVARVTRRLTTEFRISSDVGEATAVDPVIPPTSFAGRGLTLGGSPDEPFADQRTTPRMSAMLHWDLGGHRFKIGGMFAAHRFETQGAIGAAGGFRFGDSDDFAAADGAWRAVTTRAASGSFRLTERALFVQDAWRVADGLSLTMGLRFDANRLPAGMIEQNAAWLAASGVDNTSVNDGRKRVAPRLGFHWELGPARNWILEGGAGVYNDLPDRRDVAEALSHDVGLDVRSAVGVLGGWPTAPTTAVAPVVGRTITLLGPEFEGPRTRRMSVALQRNLGAWTTYVRGLYRQTDFLSRRRDLNLPATPRGRDQYGRPLYGALQQVGSLLVPSPGSNRRFPGFEAVNALEVTGFSEFWAVTTGVERVVDRGLSLGLHYTYSRTTDNVSGGAAAALGSLPEEVAGRNWTEGTAEADAPHRVIAAVEWSPAPSGAVRLGAVYRLRSGAPFTPGFRDGVDANGDGEGSKDPAFIDAAAPGMDALIAEWSCLKRDAGEFADRNGCRGEWRQRVDLRAVFRLGDFTSGPIDLVVDALDVFAAAAGRVDRALMLVDRTGVVTTNPLTGVTTVPLVVNPNFGELLANRATGALFRVGLRIGR